MRIRPLLWSCVWLAGGLLSGPVNAASRDADAVFSRLADEYIGGYLAFRQRPALRLACTNTTARPMTSAARRLTPNSPASSPLTSNSPTSTPPG